MNKQMQSYKVQMVRFQICKSVDLSGNTNSFVDFFLDNCLLLLPTFAHKYPYFLLLYRKNKNVGYFYIVFSV